MLMVLLIDDASAAFGGSPDPDGERERRWQPANRRVLRPILASFGCLIASAATPAAEPVVTYGLSLFALGFCAVAARAALDERPRH